MPISFPGEDLTPEEDITSLMNIGSLPLLPMEAHCPVREKLSVLVLDHDPASLLINSKMLAKLNFKVLPFQTAEAALDSLKRGVAKDEEFDLVLAEVHLSNTAMGTLALFHHILDKLQVPLITMCAYEDEETVSKCMALGACFHVPKPLNTGTFNILKQKALQHRSRRAIPEGSSFLKKTKSRKNSSSTKSRMCILESETEEDEPDERKAHGNSKKPGRATWSTELHEKFLKAVEVLGEKSAKPEKILRQMNVKNLTTKQVASHLQKHKLREQKAKQGGQNQLKDCMKPASDLIASLYKAATSKPINQLATTQTLITPRLAASITDKYPRRLWTQLEKRPPEAAASNTSTCASAILGDDTKSVWDKYQKNMPKNMQKRLSISRKRKLLSVKSKAAIEDEGIANIASNVAGGKDYGALASAPLESSGSSSMLTSLLDQVLENSRAEAAGNNGNLENVAQYEDNMKKEYATAMGVDGLVDLGSNALLNDDICKNLTAEMELPDPSYVCEWEEVERFFTSQPEGSQEQQYLGLDYLLQVDNAWNHALQPADLTNMDAPMAQESATVDAPAYDPAQQFAEGDPFWGWSPEMFGDYDMLL